MNHHPLINKILKRGSAKPNTKAKATFGQVPVLPSPRLGYGITTEPHPPADKVPSTPGFTVARVVKPYTVGEDGFALYNIAQCAPEKK